MASKIILKKSSVAAKAPVAGDLEFGELAINYTDSKLYFKKADGSIDAFTSAAASAPVTSVGGNIGAVTDAQLLASIKNVDGTGSGLDADFLDGLNASAFYLASNPNGYTSNTGTVTSVGATAPLVSSGGTAPSISIPAANSTTNGYMSSAYAAKLDGIAAGATNVTNNNQLTNGAGYITSAALASYLPLTGGTLTGSLFGTTITATFESSNARFKFKAADAYSGSYAIIGLDWGGAVGTYKNLAVYDYVNGRSVVEFIGDTRAVNVYGIVNSSLTSGTMFSNASMTDSIGWNSSYGMYIGSTVGGTKYLYANGSFFDGSANRALLHAGNHTSYSMPSGSSATNSVDVRAPIFYDSNDTGYYIDPSSYSRIRQLTLTQARVDSSKYPVGHYAPGEEVFAIDPTWTQDQLREYFNSNNVSWVADSTAPGGYAIQLTGAINVGGVYGSGFPYIPVETDDTFYMEVYIKNVTGSNTHYMGSMDFNHNFTNLGGNPGSFGYWVMSNNNPGTGWTKYSGYISGFGTATGQFVSGTEYWTPQALFNYSGGGTSYISGWKVLKLTKGIVGRFPNSTVNTGEAWYGRANDRNRGTYTIQLGGNSASGRQFEVVDYAWSTVMFRVDSANFSESAGSSRAPIFYDSNDTGYYIDPNSTSNTAQRMRGGTLYGPNPTWGAYLYVGTDGRVGSEATVAVTNGNLHLDSKNGYQMYLNYYSTEAVWTGGNLGVGSTSASYRLHVHGTGYATSDFRAPIFYDANDTAYYVDPNSTSRMVQVNFNNLYYAPDTSYGFIGSSIYVDTINSGYANDQLEINYVRGTWAGISHDSLRAPLYYDYNDTAYYTDQNGTSSYYRINVNNNILFTNYGRGMIGTYASTVYQAVFAMGDSYKLPDNGSTTGNLYGLAWSHPNAGGTAGNLNTHGLLVLENGGFLAAVSGSIRSRDDMRTPIFYDSNDTGYYLDANGTSRLNYLRPNRISIVGNQDNGYPRWDFKAYVVESQHWYAHNSSMDMYMGEGNAIWTYNLRSNIYYDRDDTAYYVDPAGSTAVRSNGVIIAGNQGFQSRFYAYGRNRIWSFADADAYGISYFQGGGGYAGSDSIGIHFGSAVADCNFIFRTNSDFIAKGNVTAYSDETLKTDWLDLPSDYVNKLAKLLSGTYTRIDTGFRQAGVGAQSLQKILPETVFEGVHLSVAYGNAAMVSAVELAKRVVEQDARIAKLEERLSKLLDD